MGRIKELFGVLSATAVIFGVLANQVMIGELSADLRATLTLSDHINMSVDNVFFIASFLLLTLILFMLAVYFFGPSFFIAMLFGAGIAVSSYYVGRTWGKTWQQLKQRRKMALQVESFESAQLKEGLSNITDSKGNKAELTFKLLFTRKFTKILLAIMMSLSALLSINLIINSLSQSHIGSLWTDGARYATYGVFFPTLILAPAIYLCYVFLRSRFYIIVDGVTFFNDRELIDRYGEEFESNAASQGIKFVEEKQKKFWQRVAWLIFPLSVLLAGFISGNAQAISYYYRILDEGEYRVVERRDAADRTIGFHSSNLIRVVEEGALAVTADGQNVIFVNDHSYIRAIFPLKHSGFAAISEVPSCPLKRLPDAIQASLQGIYVLDLIPRIGVTLGGCKTLGEMKKQANDQLDE